MILRNTIAVLVTAALLALVAYLIEISTHLPEPAAYFAIALLAASFTLAITGKTTSVPRSRVAAKARTAVHASKERGKVKWFSASKGFGFITRDSGEDIFVHFRSIHGEGHKILREGQRVEFAVTEGDKGLQAEEVVALK